MKTYEMRGGGTVSGDNAREVLDAIRNSSYDPEADLGAFVRELSERCKIYDGSIIRTTSDEDTLADLISSGFLTEKK